MPSLQNQRILVVDDCDSNRMLMKLVLGRSGAQIVEAENGMEALELVAKEPFDLIIMDMQMPILDGYSAAQELRNRGIEIPIIAMTAHALKGDEEVCRQAGCTGYVSKPIDLDNLLKMIDDTLSSATQAWPTVASRGQRYLPPGNGTAGSVCLESTLSMDDSAFQSIVKRFQVRLIERLAEMHTALDQYNFDELLRLAHWLKGTGGGAGFPILTDLAAELEQSTEQSRSDDCRRLITEIQKTASRIVVE